MFWCFIVTDYKDSSEHRQLIRRNYVQLLELIDAKYSSLLDLLFSSGVIDRREDEQIRSAPTSIEQTEKLLAFISRKSSETFQQFIRCLDEAQQKHVADLLRLTTGYSVGVRNFVVAADYAFNQTLVSDKR